MAKDYYAVLGITRGADDVVVHAAWKALLRKYHPDANADATAQARARDINEAFAVLGKPAARASYDRTTGPQHRPAPNRPPPGPAPRPGQAYRSTAYAPPPRQSPHQARAPRRLPAILLLIAALLAAALMINRYPDALPELGDRIRSFADVNTARATFVPAGLDDMMAADAIPPVIDRNSIAAAVRRADRLLASGGTVAAANASRVCNAAATTIAALDECVAFNIAISISQATTPDSLVPPDPYFALALERDALHSDQLVRSPTLAEDRLARIRELVVPQAMSLLIARLERTAARLDARGTPRRPADRLSVMINNAHTRPIAALDSADSQP